MKTLVAAAVLCGGTSQSVPENAGCTYARLAPKAAVRAVRKISQRSTRGRNRPICDSTAWIEQVLAMGPDTCGVTTAEKIEAAFPIPEHRPDHYQRFETHLVLRTWHSGCQKLEWIRPIKGIRRELHGHVRVIRRRKF